MGGMKMLIVGEKINTSRKEIGKAVKERNREHIAKIAKEQADAGADIIDVNCGTSVETEADDMTWLIEIVKGVVSLPICIDSPNPKVIEHALSLYDGETMINSITADKERAEEVLVLAAKTNARVVALTMDEKGMPHTRDERVDIAARILKMAGNCGVDKEKIYFDPLVRPLSTDANQTIEVLEAIRLITEKLGAKTICGLSNISFGLPNRSLINGTFLTMALTKGLDAAIIDPTDKKLMSMFIAGEALLGRDEYCMKYIRAARDGRL